MRDKIMLTAAAALAAALTVSACGSPDGANARQASENAAAQVDAEPAPIPSEAAEKDANAPVMDDASKALLASLSPQELGMARLSCVRPLSSAQSNLHLFDDALAAELKAAPSLPQTALITSIEGMTIASAREILDQGPWFTPAGPAPTADQVTGLKQCIVLAHHYQAEKAAQ